MGGLEGSDRAEECHHVEDAGGWSERRGREAALTFEIATALSVRCLVKLAR